VGKGKSGRRSGKARYYEIVVRGEHEQLLTETLGDIDIQIGGGRTVFTVAIEDEAQFYWVVDRLRDHALELISLREVVAPQA
jgi:hypothetical protein